jgi:hypothetical protein
MVMKRFVIPFQLLRMRGGTQLIICLLLVTVLHSACAIHCDREPRGRMPPKTKADHRFKIKISGNPDKYVPGEVYTSKRVVCFIEKIRPHKLKSLALLDTVGLFPCGTIPCIR